MKDNKRNARKNCSLTSRSSLLLFPFHNILITSTEEAVVSRRPFISLQKSSMKGVPVLSLQGALHLNPRVDPHQNEAVVQMWMEVKLKPLLHSITKNFLSCLSTKNFSCSTYQTMYVQAHEAPVDAYSRLSPPCLLLQGEGAEPPFF